MLCLKILLQRANFVFDDSVSKDTIIKNKIDFQYILMSCPQDTMTVQIYLKPYAYRLNFDRQILATKEAKTSMLASILADEPDIETITLNYRLMTPRALHCVKAFLEGGHKPKTTDPALEKAGHYLGIPLMRGWEKQPGVTRIRLPNYGYSRLIYGRIPHQTLSVLQGNYDGMTPTQVDILASITENDDVFPGPHEPALNSHIFGEHSILPFMGTPHFDTFRETFPEVNLFKAETFEEPNVYMNVLKWALDAKMPPTMQLRVFSYIIETIGWMHRVTDADYSRSDKRNNLFLQATERNLVDIVKYLLTRARAPLKALTIACTKGYVDIVKAFLEHRICCLITNQDAAFKAAKRNHHREIVRLLKAQPGFMKI